MLFRSQNGDINPDLNARAIAMVLMTVPMGHTLMSLAGLERVEDADWMPLLVGMATALKPSK